jgi:hypothetical protein
MQHRKLSIALTGVLTMAASFAANGAIVFQDIGNVAPPAQLGVHTMTPFDQTPQAAIAEYTVVTSIPGGPGGSVIGVTPASMKVTDGTGWNAPTSWPGGANVFFFSQWGVSTQTLTLPPNTKAIYFYVESNYYSTSFDYTVTTDSGATSTPVVVAGNAGAHGFGFYSTAGENITSITVSGNGLGGGGFILGQFGINNGVATTCASEGYTGTQLLWCRNICEKGYTGATLEMWIRRWLGRWRDLPYCAAEGQEEEPQEN